MLERVTNYSEFGNAQNLTPSSTWAIFEEVHGEVVGLHQNNSVVRLTSFCRAEIERLLVFVHAKGRLNESIGIQASDGRIRHVIAHPGANQGYSALFIPADQEEVL